MVMTGAGEFVEIQGTAEARPFDQATLMAMLDLARSGIETLLLAQMNVLHKLSV